MERMITMETIRKAFTLPPQGVSVAQHLLQGNNAPSQDGFRTFANPEEIIVKGVKAVKKALPKMLGYVRKSGRRVVLLGRDGWTFFPFLLDEGIRVQYFMWSRLQSGDPETARVWMEEVGPGPKLVIDTGYEGRIFRNIELIDPEAEFALVQSAGFYPRIMDRDFDHMPIEKMPKRVSRSVTYVGDRCQTMPLISRWDSDCTSALGMQQEVAKALDLPEAWGRFTGLTREERTVKSVYDLRGDVDPAEFEWPVLSQPGGLEQFLFELLNYENRRERVDWATFVLQSANALTWDEADELMRIWTEVRR